MQNNIFKILIVPEITLTILSIVCLLYGLFLNKNSFRKTSNFAIFVLLLTSVLVYYDYKTEFADYNQFFASSIFINYFKILVLIGSALSIIISKNYFIDLRLTKFEIPTLLLFSTLGMLLMISSNNLMMMYLSIELQSYLYI